MNQMVFFKKKLPSKQVTLRVLIKPNALKILCYSIICLPVVELLVEDEEELVVVNQVGDDLCLWPRALLEELLRQLGERVLVQVGNLVRVARLDGVPRKDRDSKMILRTKSAKLVGFVPI